MVKLEEKNVYWSKNFNVLFKDAIKTIAINQP